jgi:hypothetical protein
VFKLFISLLCLTSLLAAQQGSPPSAELEGPVLGFAFDRGIHRLQPILGVPGASFMGPVIETGFEITDAVISPRQNYAFALTVADRQVQLVKWNQGSVSAADLDGARPAVDRIVLSPSGTAAGLYYATDGTIQVFTGLPDSPVLAWARQAPAATATVRAIADDGDALIVSTKDAASPFLLLGGGFMSSLPVSERASVAAFRPGSHDVLIANRMNNQILLLQDVLGAMSIQPVAGATDGIAGPTAVEFSADGSKAFVANSLPGSIATLDLNAHTVSVTPCGCRPTGLHRLATPSLFRLNEPSDQPMLLFDAGGSSPRVLFVPPDQNRSAR